MKKSFLKEMAIMLVLVTITSVITSQLIAVPTDSMSPDINPGDMVLVEKTNLLDVFAELDVGNVKEGDVVLYTKPIKVLKGEEMVVENETVIHRVVAVKGPQGGKYLLTKGDNNPSLDSERVNPKQITGRAVQWDGKTITIPAVGHAVIFIKTLIEGGGE